MALAALANYLSLDRPDIQYAAKEIHLSMSKPKQRSWAKLKKVGALSSDVLEAGLQFR